MSDKQKTSTTAHDAAKAEAAGETTLSVKWRDLTFTFPPFDEWTVDVLEAAENGQQIGALSGVLGPQQWRAFKASTPKPVQADILALSELIGNATAGASVGESAPPSDS